MKIPVGFRMKEVTEARLRAIQIDFARDKCIRLCDLDILDAVLSYFINNCMQEKVRTVWCCG